jgi:hypothetical protein
VAEVNRGAAARPCGGEVVRDDEAVPPEPLRLVERPVGQVEQFCGRHHLEAGIAQPKSHELVGAEIAVRKEDEAPGGPPPEIAAAIVSSSYRGRRSAD